MDHVKKNTLFFGGNLSVVKKRGCLGYNKMVVASAIIDIDLQFENTGC